MNSNYRSLSLLFLATFALACLLGGCRANALPSQSAATLVKEAATTPVAFKQVVNGESYTANLENPVLEIARDSQELARLVQLIDPPEANRQLAAVNLENDFLLAFFRGQVGSSGYDVEIQEIAKENNEIHVKVKLTEPLPGQIVQSVIAFPYDTVRIARQSLTPSPNQKWIVYDSAGALLLETTTP